MPSAFNHLGAYLFLKICVHALYVPDTVVGAGDTVGKQDTQLWSLCSLYSSIKLCPLYKHKLTTSTRNADQCLDSLVTLMNSPCLVTWHHFMVH